MKLRIIGDPLRVRLSEPEVGFLSIGETLRDSITFPSSSLVYVIQPVAETSIDFLDSTIHIDLSTIEIEKFAKTDQVTISKEIVTHEEKKLSILVEKDFRCLTNRAEDESDLFPNSNNHHCNI